MTSLADEIAAAERSPAPPVAPPPTPAPVAAEIRDIKARLKKAVEAAETAVAEAKVELLTRAADSEDSDYAALAEIMTMQIIAIRNRYEEGVAKADAMKPVEALGYLVELEGDLCVLLNFSFTVNGEEKFFGSFCAETIETSAALPEEQRIAGVAAAEAVNEIIVATYGRIDFFYQDSDGEVGGSEPENVVPEPEPVDPDKIVVLESSDDEIVVEPTPRVDGRPAAIASFAATAEPAAEPAASFAATAEPLAAEQPPSKRRRKNRNRRRRRKPESLWVGDFSTAPVAGIWFSDDTGPRMLRREDRTSGPALTRGVIAVSGAVTVACSPKDAARFTRRGEPVYVDTGKRVPFVPTNPGAPPADKGVATSLMACQSHQELVVMAASVDGPGSVPDPASDPTATTPWGIPFGAPVVFAPAPLEGGSPLPPPSVRSAAGAPFAVYGLRSGRSSKLTPSMAQRLMLGTYVCRNERGSGIVVELSACGVPSGLASV